MSPSSAANGTGHFIEYTIHECPRRHRDEVQSVFPGQDLSGLLVVPTCQRAAVELVATGEAVEEQKDLLLESFMDFARAVCERLSVCGHWADYIDPCSGLPMIHRAGMKVYDEVSGLASLRGYRTQNAGCCKVVLHPEWGSRVYPATLFAICPHETLVAALESVSRELGIAARCAG